VDAAAVGPNPSVTPGELRELILDVRELQRRVSILEQKELNPAPALPLPPGPLDQLEVSSDAIPMVGFALLGIAGAYLLRALTELGTIPRGVGVAAGICYAAFWLWLAARTSAERRFAAAVRASTSVLIFAPLIWESVVRFKALSAWTAAAIVFAFCVASEAISWRKNLKVIAAVAPAACAVLAVLLLIGTYALAPFTLALLAIAAAVEFAAVQNHATEARWMVAACVDSAVLALTMLMGRPGGLPEGYAPVSIYLAVTMQGLLLVVYATSAMWRSLWRARVFTMAEIGQTAAAFLLGAGGIALITGRAFPVGMFALASGTSCYVFATRLATGRNMRAYATFGLLLVASAMWLMMSGIALIGAWSALAVIASIWNSGESGGAHTAVFLWLALMVSRVAERSAEVFFGGGASFPAAPAAIILVAAALSYLAVRRRIPALFIAAGLAGVAAGQLAGVLRFPCSGTIVLTAVALVLAWVGVRWHRKELVWLMYPFMVLAGFRIVMRDLPSATTMDLVIPLLLFGAALILLPRILQAQEP
jgi:hypothetical protein